jgi:MFS family permease
MGQYAGEVKMANTPSKQDKLWHHPDFLLLWGGQTVSQVGSQVTLWALPLVAVLTLKATPFQMGILAFVGRLPLLLIGLIAGVLVDRISSRVILIVTDFGRAILIGSIPIAALLHRLSLTQFYVITFLVGCLSAFFDVAYQSFLPSLVERDQLIVANSRLEASNALASIIGPGFAGVLVQLFSGPIAILVDAFSFFLSAFSLLFVRVREAPHAIAIKHRWLWNEIGEGIYFVWRQPLIRVLMLTSALFNFFDSILMAEYVFYLTRTLGMGAIFVGAVGVASGVGWLVGALLAEPITKRVGMGFVLSGCILLACLAEACIALANGPFLFVLCLVMAGEFLIQCVATIYVINNTSVRQMLLPFEIRGRVNALVRVISGGATALGALLAAVLAQSYGLRLTLIIAAAGTLSAFVLIVVSPLRRVKSL